MANIERRWTLLLRRDTGTIYRVREGDRPISVHGCLDFERVVVVPEAQLQEAVEALREVAARPVVERNPDGEDQAAHTMQLIARETLARLGGR